MFSAATVPKPEVKKAWSKRFIPFRTEEQAEPVFMRGLVKQGWHHKDIGWDHRDLRWYHPVWPKLDCELSPSELRTKWKLDWEREGEAVANVNEA